MLDHLSIQCADIAASVAFYDSVLATLGGKRLMSFGDVHGYGIDFPSFWLGPLSAGPLGDAAGGRESHIAFTAQDRAGVLAFRDAAGALGAEILHEPREWPQYHAGYFGVFVRDPDNNNVEAVCHVPA